MPEQFVNPSPNMNVQGLLCFDFPCEGSEAIDIASTYRNTNPAKESLPNFNLAATGTERLYGAGGGLGSPKKEQGHPYISEKEIGAAPPYGEVEDPSHVDQIVDADRGMFLCHTGRLSGGFVPSLAGTPNFSIVKVTAVAVSPVPDPNKSIILDPGTKVWLTPKAMAANVWFWKPGTTTNELIYSAHYEIDQALSALQFVPEAIYKLVFHWEFWRVKTGLPTPSNPPNTGPDTDRLPISGFDESIAFQVSTGTTTIP